VGDAPKLPPFEVMAQFEEADILIVVADNNNSIEKRDLAQPFTGLGYYWRLVENYPRAIARFMRAIDIDPSSLMARRGLCGTIYNYAARETRPQLKKQLLDQAEDECKKALEISSADPGAFFDLGWILDERGDFEGAASAYRNSQRLDVRGDRPNATYNLACTLSKWGAPHLGDALVELGKVIEIDDNREQAAQDEDFKNLARDPEFGPLFSTLVTKKRTPA